MNLSWFSRVTYRCLAIILVALGTQPLRVTAAVPKIDTDAVATHLVQQLINKDFAKAESDFDDRMKHALSPEQLEKNWARRAGTEGAPRIGEVHDVPYKEYTIVWVKMLTQQDYFWTKVVIDANQKVAGLGFARSSAPTPGATSP